MTRATISTGISARRLLIVAVALGAIWVVPACSGQAAVQPSTDAPSSVPVVTPTSANPPYPLRYDAQRETFNAFLRCASEHGVEFEGPFTDSTGKGIYTRLAPGEDATKSQQDKVVAACPELTVGLFGTPIGSVDVGAFTKTATAFARCVGGHGYPSYPSGIGGGDPVAAFWSLPFEWSSASFVAAVSKCVDALRAYMLSA
jgi:hypothetical protein